MTTIGDIIFAIVWFGALIVGIRLMSNGWSLMSNNKREWKDYYEDLPQDMGEEIKKSTHPEMQNLQPGDELIVVKFTQDQEESVDRDRFKLDSPELHNLDGDSLHKSLQERIDKLREENKKDDEDDDDDDGGAPVVARV